MNYLIYEGVLTKNKNHFFVSNTNFKTKDIEQKTLVEKISNDIKEEISDAKEVEEKAIGDTDEAGSIKIPSGLMPGSREVEPSINIVDKCCGIHSIISGLFIKVFLIALG